LTELESFLELYGLPAVFVLMLTKAIGVPVPIPADVIMLAAAAGAAEGRLSLWQAFVAILVAMVLGGLVQFGLARGVGRGPLYRFGPTLGLTSARLDAAAGRVRRGGVVGIGIAILTPGIRAATVAACGLADLPTRVFLPGLVLGTTLFVTLHFAIGIAAAPLLSAMAGSFQLWQIGTLAFVLLCAGLVAWLVIRRRERPAASQAELVAEAVEAWHEATCPVCLVLGSTAGAPAPPRKQAAG
jgi:membrane protein DedA with SNARE-associated domain